MTRRLNPEPFRCAWCDMKAWTRRELADHEAGHWREERVTPAKEVTR